MPRDFMAIPSWYRHLYIKWVKIQHKCPIPFYCLSQNLSGIYIPIIAQSKALQSELWRAWRESGFIVMVKKDLGHLWLGYIRLMLNFGLILLGFFFIKWNWNWNFQWIFFYKMEMKLKFSMELVTHPLVSPLLPYPLPCLFCTFAMHCMHFLVNL